MNGALAMHHEYLKDELWSLSRVKELAVFVRDRGVEFFHVDTALGKYFEKVLYQPSLHKSTVKLIDALPRLCRTVPVIRIANSNSLRHDD